MSDDLSEYERRTRKLFWLGPFAFYSWVRMHRDTLKVLFADARMTEDAKDAAREAL